MTDDQEQPIMDQVRRGRGGRGGDRDPGKFEKAAKRNPGDMHEPKPYTAPLDWDTDPVLHPFVD